MTIALFDLDQTLVDVSEYHIKAFKKAFKNACNINVEADLIRAQFGKVEHEFVSAPLRKKGFKEKLIQEKVEQVISEYKIIFSKEIANASSKNILPGVKKLLEELRRKRVFLALVTGEEEAMGRFVLKKTNLQKYFKSFTFGSKAKTRKEILTKAIKDAKNSGGEGKIVVIGDSLYDIKAAKEVRCKVIAVATGFVAADDLKAAKPDFLFRDLTDTKRIITVIEEI